MIEPSRTHPPAQPHHTVVPPDLHGTTLRDYLEGRWPQVDRVFVRRLVEEGRVDVNGEVADLRRRLRRDDVVSVRLPVPVRAMPEHRELGGQRPIAVYEDDEVVIVDKPAGVPSEPDRAGKVPGVRGALEADRPGQRLRVLQRLATDASGCLVFAKSVEVLRRLTAGVADGSVCLEHLALVTGALRRPALVLARALGPDPRRPGLVKVVDEGGKGARAARTTVACEEAFRTHTLVRAVPDAVRGHQVRAHLSGSGHPIVGDRDYGTCQKLLLSEIKRGYKSRRGVAERPLLERMFLHVGRVAWPGADGEARMVSVDLPPDLAVVVAKLRSFASIPAP